MAVRGQLALMYANIHLRALVCRQEIDNDAEWLEANLGPFSLYTTYSDLNVFNLSVVRHAFHCQSTLKTAAQSLQLGQSVHRGDFSMSKRKAIHIFSLFVSSGGTCGLPVPRPEG